jgi:hypothetical protein
MEREAEQLRCWITHRQAEVSASPEIPRMVYWAKAELAGLEAFLDPLKLSQLLIARNLFPEVDELVDLLGEPPPRDQWGR